MAKPENTKQSLVEALGIETEPDWGPARHVLRGLGVLLVGIYILAVIVAVMVLVQVADGNGASLGAGALVVALISSPFLIWNTIIRQTTLNFQKEGHLTDRLAKAVEQLGAEKTVKKIVEGVTQETSEPNLEVRMGGLLSLERIAQDSTAYDKGRDHVRVMEIICAYIRNNAPASMAKDFPLGDLEPLEEGATDEQREAYLRQIEAREHEREDWLTTVNKPREDIMLALTILERRSDKQRRIEAAHGQDGVTEAEWIFATPAPELPEPPVDEAHLRDAVADLRRGLSAWRNALSSYGGYRPDLRDTCLQKLDLSDFRLQGVRLERARLEGANLMEARLEGADLMEARLEGADLMEARLEGAVLEGARLEGADLMEARLQGAVLEEARLEGADLMEARLEGAVLWRARLQGAVLREARLEGARLQGARLQGAVLMEARLQGAVLMAARLQGAHLEGARLEGANLMEARLQGADLEEARLDRSTDLRGADFSGSPLRSVDLSTVRISQDQVNASFGDGSVTLPPTIDRPAHWPEGKLHPREFYRQWRLWQSGPASDTPPPKPDP